MGTKGGEALGNALLQGNDTLTRLKLDRNFLKDSAWLSVKAGLEVNYQVTDITIR